jgi:hypothetical protein
MAEFTSECTVFKRVECSIGWLHLKPIRKIGTEALYPNFVNAEDRLVLYHQAHGFEVVPGFFEGMPAKRMAMGLAEFVQTMNQRANSSVSNSPQLRMADLVEESLQLSGDLCESLR